MQRTNQPKSISKKWLHIVFGILLILSFFLPWVQWGEQTINGYDLPKGKFFAVSSAQFGLENPFPQLSFTFNIFWLIPVLTLLSILFVSKKNKLAWLAFIAGALSLSLVTVFYLFTNTLIDLGVGNNVYQMLQLPAYISLVAAAGFIVTAITDAQWYKKIFWIIIGPILAFSAYKFGERQVFAETHQSTDNVTTDFTISATDMLNEFAANDSLANAKYREKIIVVNGNASQVERTSDSTTNIRFDDPAGSYIVFSFEKDQYLEAKNITPGDPVSLKGSCSGSIYSEILGITSISFKRSTIHKK